MDLDEKRATKRRIENAFALEGLWRCRQAMLTEWLLKEEAACGKNVEGAVWGYNREPHEF